MTDSIILPFELCQSDTQRRFVAGEWASSDELDVDWMGDTEGRWRKYSTGTKYQKADRTYYTDEWAKIKGEWYYFGSDSYMKTGWIQLAGTWFYLENRWQDEYWLGTDQQCMVLFQ